MSTSSTLTKFTEEAKERIRKFRIETSRSDVIKSLPIRIQEKTYEIVIDEEILKELEDLTEIDEEYREALPDNLPRYILMAYPLTNKDGIKQTPLVLVYWVPQTCVSQEWKMCYANALEMVRNQCGTSKLVEITSGLEEDEDFEELKQQLSK